MAACWQNQIFIIGWLWLFVAQSIFGQPADFPDLLLDEDDKPVFFEPVPFGNFERIDGDWILCVGKFNENSPPSGPNFSVKFQNSSYNDIAKFNNDAVQLALSSANTKAHLTTATQMWQEGYRQDPQFFAFNYNLSRALTIQRDFKTALFYAERSAQMMPNDFRLNMLLAALYERSNLDIAAQNHYKQAIRKNPFSAAALVALAGFYSRTDRESLAEDLLRRGMERFETDRSLRLGLAELRFRQKKLNQSRILLESIEVLPNDRSSFALRRLNLLAKVYDLVGSYRRSFQAYNSLLTTTTEPFFIDKNIDALKRERSRVERLSKIE
ncbi:MAG: hypothetical protein H3C43_08495 [Leptonema sp. (in: Bacteria)]|nr:hypothetical protein [Leptonema sp. (in: bacteria)]